MNNIQDKLYSYQKDILEKMLYVENTRKISKQYRNISMTRTTDAAVLEEPMGSGKTVETLSLIDAQKFPKIKSNVSNMNINSRGPLKISVKRKYKKILTPTIIFVGSSVLKQWINTIENFTNLSYFTVTGIHDIKKMFDLIDKRISKNVENKSYFFQDKKRIKKKRMIDNYDIVLVKNGTVINGKTLRNIRLPDNLKWDKKNRSNKPFATFHIYNIVANLNNYCWARLVIDDFDLIKLPKKMIKINAIFTWYISSTKHRKFYPGLYYGNPYVDSKSVEEYFTHVDNFCDDILDDKDLFECFNVNLNGKAVRDKSIERYGINYYAYVLNMNKIGKFMKYFKDIGSNRAKTIMNMLNGDAVSTAAEEVGIKTNNPLMIFKKILDTEFDKYRNAIKIIEFIEKNQTFEAIRNRKPLSQIKDNDEHTSKKYSKRDLTFFRPIKYNYPNIDNILEESKTRYSIIKEKIGYAIERVKDNINHGECAICFDNLEDSADSVILTCCGVIMCSECFVPATKMTNKGDKILGKCSHCRQSINLTDIIYLDSKKTNIKSIFDKLEDSNNLKETKEEKEEEKEEKEKKEDEDNLQYSTSLKLDDKPKLKQMLDIILSENISRKKSKTCLKTAKINIKTTNLLKSNPNNVGVKPNYKKILIFADYDETIKYIHNLTSSDNNSKKFQCWVLEGTYKNIYDKAVKFQNYNDNCILIINSAKHCSGIELNTATDIIFAHHISDVSVRSQVIGRAQRIGRKYDLNVHFVLYKNEYETAKMRNDLKEIS